MIMKHILKLASLCAVMTLGACSDFFNVSTDNVLDHTEYINEESEMYAGYIGIMTKVQAIGDKIIYLTDTRGEMLEPTVNTPYELYALYNYDDDLTGNSYADPAGYYDVIIACNDYLLKLYDYKNNHLESINEEHYKALISCTLRVKAWTYLTLAKVYGKAVWFDDPMREKKDLSLFPELDLDAVVDKCIELLEDGFDKVNGKLSISWKEWLDPNTATASSIYRYWDCMTPEYFALRAELCLWDGDYQKAATLLLSAMNEKFGTTVNDATTWLHNSKLTGIYATIWNNSNPLPQETVSAIIYDYTKNQTNSLLKHFGIDSPNEYLLAPSEAGQNRFSDELNPLGTQSEDPRARITFTMSNGKPVIRKFRPLNSSVRPNAYQDDVHIYIYRGAELYFMLAEALNNLERFEPADCLINQGIGTILDVETRGGEWAGLFSSAWTKVTAIGPRTYADLGIRGTQLLASRNFTKDKQKNDSIILDEILLELSCEGKVYPAMIRMAKRYGDYSIIADRVCPKYQNSEAIREKIMNGGYFVPWDLKK